jgi:peroxiredoxin
VSLGQRALTWLLGGLAAILALLTLGALWLAHTASPRKTAASSPPPPVEALRVGMAAPDFVLLDEHESPRRLSEFNGKPSVLLFFCGCSRCQLMAQALGDTEKPLRGEKPRHIVVTTMTPEESRTWQERTGFHALFLFDKNLPGSVIQQFSGHPCPRVYVLDRQRSIRYISPNPEGVAELDQVVDDLTAALRDVSTPGPAERAAPARRHAAAGQERLAAVRVPG